MGKKEITPQNHYHQTRIRAIFWFIFILVFVGLGLIYFFYGGGAALTGFLCLLAMLIPTLMIAIALWGLDFYLKITDSNDGINSTPRDK